MTARGFNPMRWDCDKSGCFNKKRRPKIEVFADCFPRGINFGDLDMFAEIGGNFLYGEWKGEGGSLGTGQRLAHDALVRAGHTVFIVDGDAETMEVRSFIWRWQDGDGKTLSRVVNPASLAMLKRWIRHWADRADSSTKRSA